MLYPSWRRTDGEKTSLRILKMSWHNVWIWIVYLELCGSVLMHQESMHDILLAMLFPLQPACSWLHFSDWTCRSSGSATGAPWAQVSTCSSTDCWETSRPLCVWFQAQLVAPVRLNMFCVHEAHRGHPPHFTACCDHLHTANWKRTRTLLCFLNLTLLLFFSVWFSLKRKTLGLTSTISHNALGVDRRFVLLLVMVDEVRERTVKKNQLV